MKRKIYSILLATMLPMCLFGQKSVKVIEAGTLPSLISDEEKYNIEYLIVAGEINGTDLRLIRDMAGNNYKGELTKGQLSRLDMSGAKIIAGGENYLDCYQIFIDESASMTDSRGFIFATANDTISQWLFVGCNSLSEVILPEDVKAIEQNAFAESLVTKVVIPDGIKHIGERAFYRNLKLASMQLPSTLRSIGPNAFAYCSGLTEIDLSYNLTEIGKNAFRKCTGLTVIRSHMSKPCEITAKTFEGVKAKLTVPKGTGSLYAAADYWSDFTDIEETEEEPKEPTEDTPTGIIAENPLRRANDGVIYDLQGIRVQNPVEGHIYIQNGCKFVMLSNATCTPSLEQSTTVIPVITRAAKDIEDGDPVPFLPGEAGDNDGF